MSKEIPISSVPEQSPEGKIGKQAPTTRFENPAVRIEEDLKRAGVEFKSKQEKKERGAKHPLLPEFAEDQDTITRVHVFGKGWIREYAKSGSGKSKIGIEKIPEIEYITSEGVSFRLSTLLPEKWRFAHLLERTDILGGLLLFKALLYTQYFKKVGIREDGELYHEEVKLFEQPEALLWFLHEIGHAVQGSSWKQTASRLASKMFRGVLPNILLQKISDIIIQDERDAWAYAIKKLLTLRKDGIDLAPEFETREKLLTATHVTLVTYEIGAENFLDKSFKGQRERRKQFLYEKIKDMGMGEGLSRRARRPKRNKSSLDYS